MECAHEHLLRAPPVLPHGHGKAATPPAGQTPARGLLLRLYGCLMLARGGGLAGRHRARVLLGVVLMPGAHRGLSRVCVSPGLHLSLPRVAAGCLMPAPGTAAAGSVWRGCRGRGSIEYGPAVARREGLSLNSQFHFCEVVIGRWRKEGGRLNGGNLRYEAGLRIYPPAPTVLQHNFEVPGYDAFSSQTRS